MKKKMNTATEDTTTENTKPEPARHKPGVVEIGLDPAPLPGAALYLDDETLEGVRRMVKDINFTFGEKIVRGTDAALVTLRECSTDEEKKIVTECYMQNMSDLCDLLLNMLRTRFEDNISGWSTYKDGTHGLSWII